MHITARGGPIEIRIGEIGTVCSLCDMFSRVRQVAAPVGSAGYGAKCATYDCLVRLMKL